MCRDHCEHARFVGAEEGRDHQEEHTDDAAWSVVRVFGSWFFSEKVARRRQHQ